MLKGGKNNNMGMDKKIFSMKEDQNKLKKDFDAIDDQMKKDFDKIKKSENSTLLNGSS